MTGTRIYSVSELKQKIIDSSYSDILDYLKNAPNYVKSIVMNMESCPQDLFEELQEKKPRRTKKVEPEVVAEPEVKIEKKRGRKKKVVEQEVVQVEETIETPIQEEKKAEISSEKMENVETKIKEKPQSGRIDLDYIVLIDYDGDECPVHKCDFEEIQIVIRYAQSKKYSFKAYYCDKCSSFYMCHTDAEEYKEIFNKKGIEYKVVPYTEGGK